MTEPAAQTPDTIGTIRRNAGKMPAAQIAHHLGWSMGRLERTARAHGYDLKCRDQDEPSPSWLAVVSRRHSLDPNTRCVSMTIMLSPADAAALDALAHECGTKRSRLVSNVIENARAHGVLPDLARRPLPRPEHTGNLDE